MGRTVKTDALNTVYTAEQYGLGSVYLEPSEEVAANGSGVSSDVTWSLLKGDREWVFIKATSAIKIGDVVVQTSGAPFEGAPVAGAEAKRATLLGVADHAIAASSYGWVIRKGVGVIRCDASGGGKSVTQNAPLVTDATAGECKNASGTIIADAVIGLALEANGGTLADFAQAYIDIG